MEKLQFRSIPDMLRHQAASYGDKHAVRYRKHGTWVTLSYAQFYDRALLAARGLRKLGVLPGDKIAVLSENRVGWIIADMGILCTGAVTVPVYPTNTPDQIAYTLNHADVRVVFISGKWQYRKLLKIKDAIPMVQLVVSIERFMGESSLPLATLNQLSEMDEPLQEQERAEIGGVIDSIAPEALMTIIYTSGTTGTPKGVMLSHHNVLFDIFATIEKAAILGAEELFLSLLPLSHVLERSVGYYLPIACGATIAYAESVEKTPENMVELQPTVMVCVPRLFEKIHSRIYEHVHQLTLYKRELFGTVLAVGRRYLHAKHLKHRVSPWLRFQHAIVDRLVFTQLRHRFGGRIKFCSSGGAPLDPEINEFFWIIGVPILEGYGLTETSPVLCSNNFKEFRLGSVGTPLEATEIAIAEDGEILARGPQLMLGYYKDEAGTSEVLDGGWLRTGDIGRLDGRFLFITDRKKDLIITAAGKNIAPQPIENLLKRDKYVSQAYVYGDRRPYLTALLVPTWERLLEFAQEKGLNYHDLEDLVVHEPVLELYRQRIELMNAELAHFETIKKFILLPRDFTLDAGELTPTLKLKRQVIADRYKDELEQMYTLAEQ